MLILYNNSVNNQHVIVTTDEVKERYILHITGFKADLKINVKSVFHNLRYLKVEVVTSQITLAKGEYNYYLYPANDENDLSIAGKKSLEQGLVKILTL